MNILTLLFLLKLTLSYPFKSNQEDTDTGVILDARANDMGYPTKAELIMYVFSDMKKPYVKAYSDHMVYYINALQDYEKDPDSFLQEYATIHNIQVGVINGLYYSVLSHGGTEHSDFYYNLFCIIFPNDEMDEKFLESARDTIVSYLKRDLSHWGEIDDDIRNDIKIMLGLQETTDLLHDEIKKRANDQMLLIMEDFWYAVRQRLRSYMEVEDLPPAELLNTDYITTTSSYLYATPVYDTPELPPQDYTEEDDDDFIGNDGTADRLRRDTANDGTAKSLKNYNNLFADHYVFISIDALYETIYEAELGDHECATYIYGLETGIDGTVANALLMMNRFYDEFKSKSLFTEERCFRVDYTTPGASGILNRISRGLTANRYAQKDDTHEYQNDEQQFNSGIIHGLTRDEAIRFTRVGYVLKGQNGKQGADVGNRWQGRTARGGGVHNLNVDYNKKIPIRKDDTDRNRRAWVDASDVAGKSHCLCIFMLLEQNLESMDLTSAAPIATKR